MKPYRTIGGLIPNLFCLAIFFVLSSSIANAQDNVSTAIEKREAEKAWDALIRMKGGRGKLESITNVLIEFSDVTQLHIFPDIKWEFGYRLDATTRRAQLIDYRANTQIYADDNGITEIGHRLFRKENIAFTYIPYLLETKWDKPKILRVRQIKEGKKKLEVIETIVENRRLDFVYEPEEMLVLEVRFMGRDGTWGESYSLSNYIEVNGIKMPQNWGLRMNEDEKYINNAINFTFNVDYDPKLLIRPLIATTPDAWKRKP